MLQLPLKKFIKTAKVCVFLVIVVTTMLMMRWWFVPRVRLPANRAIWLPASNSQVIDPVEAEYERQVAEDEARILPGLGEGGAPAILSGHDQELGQLSLKKLAMNVYLSDRIPYNRSLEDRRNPACKEVVYDAELPSASVVIIFHNEPFSVLVRTIWSVMTSARRDRPWFQQANYIDPQTGRTMTLGYPGQDPSSPLVYLKEIILVDDNSTLPELKGKLNYYVRTRLPPDLIRIVRLPERVGLTCARLAGARAAVGSVLVFLDAHCEVQPDWLRPLLQRIKDAPHTAVVPLINSIDNTYFNYSKRNLKFMVGGFTFNGFFAWMKVQERELQRRGSDIAPTKSPTMAGGLFAMNRKYYFHIGAYDEQMRGWGGENIEISFRIWQCGGALETIPCSLVGHMFRGFHPYALPGSSDTFGINTARMAEVWMDDYKELFYLHRPDLRNSPKVGDVSSRKLLREKLQCKSFEWYLQHVYPEKFVFLHNAVGYGRFRNVHTGMCLDNLQGASVPTPLGVYQCHGDSKRDLYMGTQHFTLTKSGQLRDEVLCVVMKNISGINFPPSKNEANAVAEKIINSWRGKGEHLLLESCAKYTDQQKWVYNKEKQLVHASGQCLTTPGSAEKPALLRRCNKHVRAQLWEIDYCELNNFGLSGGGEPSEVEKILNKLRQRPISTS